MSCKIHAEAATESFIKAASFAELVKRFCRFFLKDATAWNRFGPILVRIVSAAEGWGLNHFDANSADLDRAEAHVTG